MPFTFEKTFIHDLVIVKPGIFPDGRGFFMETYKESDFVKNGITLPFVQDNHSMSSKGVLRGLHFQKGIHSQGKLVRVLHGSIWDVAVDLRYNSVTYGKWFGIELNAQYGTMLYIPPGFAHGFVTLEERTEFFYKCTAEYNVENDGGIRWDDPDIAIRWPIGEVSVSLKDKSLPFMKDINCRELWP